MPPSRKSEAARPLGDALLSPRGGFQRRRWVVLAVAVTLQVVLVLVMRRTGANIHPLAPLGAAVTLVTVLVAGFCGPAIGLASALTAVVAAVTLMAELSTTTGLANAVVSAVIWCLAAIVTGTVVSYLRRQVARREAALAQALTHSLSARRQMERVLEFTPNFHEGDTPAEVAQAICDAAVEAFGADGARLYAITGDDLEALAVTNPIGRIAPGFRVPITAFPKVDEMFANHRPDYARDVRAITVADEARAILDDLHVVSVIRIPIFSPKEPTGLLVLGWTHPIERPPEELMAIMQRFADQAGIAWQNALRAEAQRQADALNKTLQRIVTLAPSFHITGTHQEVARAVCEAAVTTFECKGAALYSVEGDRITVQDRFPPLRSLPRGRTFPFGPEMPLWNEILSPTPTFIADVGHPSRSTQPWPPEVIAEVGSHTALYIPLRLSERGPENLLILSWNTEREPPDDAFLVVVERFADQVALALTNASAQRLHARLEASLLPTTPVDHPLVDVITRYRTGEQRLRLGGDFLGSTAAGVHALHFIIGDVSGHGPDAAALGATLRSTWKALVLAGVTIPEAADVMRTMLVMEKPQPNAFATIIAGEVDLHSRTLSFVNAGHLPPLLIADRVLSLDTCPQPPLGVGKGRDLALAEFPLPERWSLFCYTDGLIDSRVAPGSSQRYGEERLKERLETWVGGRPDGAQLDALLNEIETGSGSHFGDDVAVLLLSTKNGP